MKVTRRLGIVFTGLMCALASCGGDDEPSSPYPALCEKADDCNFLLQGVTVEECVDQTNQCLDKLDKADRDELYDLGRECLKIDDCQEWNTCYRGMDLRQC